MIRYSYRDAVGPATMTNLGDVDIAVTMVS